MRRVARPDQLVGMRDIPEDPIEAADIEKIMTELGPVENEASVAAGVQEIAGEYRRWREQPPSSREVISHDLRRLIDAIENCPPDVRNIEVVAEMVEIVAPEVRDWLYRWAHILPGDIATQLRSGALSLGSLTNAARMALSAQVRGDVKDPNLALAVQHLVDLYQIATDKPATWSGKPDGAIGSDGGARLKGHSSCARFVHAVFAAIDPEIPHTRLDNLIRSLIALRRKRKRRQI